MRAASLIAALVLASPVLAQGTRPATAPQAPAQAAAARPVNWVIDGTLEYGGDTYVTLPFTDGTSQDLKAGQGATFSVGADIRPPALPNFGVRAMLGVKWSGNAAENSNVSFTRIPVEVVASYYLPENWRVGAGLAYHAAANFNGDGFVNDISFDPAAGYTAEIGWKWVALTYTGIEYKIGSGPALNASGFGVSFNWVFNK